MSDGIDLEDHAASESYANTGKITVSAGCTVQIPEPVSNHSPDWKSAIGLTLEDVWGCFLPARGHSEDQSATNVATTRIAANLRGAVDVAIGIQGYACPRIRPIP